MIGCDIINIDRVKRSYKKFGRQFISRILTEAEQEIFYARNESASFLAGRFAAKEAVAKAFKTGIGTLSFTDIEILPDELGAPTLKVNGKPAENMEISISHCKDYAIAVCVGK